MPAERLCNKYCEGPEPDASGLLSFVYLGAIRDSLLIATALTLWLPPQGKGAIIGPFQATR
jgi:hypothetical protein